MRVLLFLVVLICSENGVCQTTNTLAINGVFEHTQKKYIENAQIKSNNSVLAYFTYVASTAINLQSINKVNWVRFNSIKLRYKGQDKFYFKNERTNLNQNHDDYDDNDGECNIINFNTKQWTVKGQNSIPDMNFNYNGTIPSFDVNINLIKDTLDKSDTLYFTLANIQSADTVKFTFADNDQLPNRHYTAFIAPNYTNQYYIPPSVFNTLVVGDKGFINIELIKYTYQTISGKTYLFKNSFSFVKPRVYIKN
jgi:hypothetical protein